MTLLCGEAKLPRAELEGQEIYVRLMTKALRKQDYKEARDSYPEFPAGYFILNNYHVIIMQN